MRHSFLSPRDQQRKKKSGINFFDPVNRSRFNPASDSLLRPFEQLEGLTDAEKNAFLSLDRITPEKPSFVEGMFLEPVPSIAKAIKGVALSVTEQLVDIPRTSSFSVDNPANRFDTPGFLKEAEANRLARGVHGTSVVDAVVMSTAMPGMIVGMTKVQLDSALRSIAQGIWAWRSGRIVVVEGQFAGKIVELSRGSFRYVDDVATSVQSEVGSVASGVGRRINPIAEVHAFGPGAGGLRHLDSFIRSRSTRLNDVMAAVSESGLLSRPLNSLSDAELYRVATATKTLVSSGDERRLKAAIDSEFKRRKLISPSTTPQVVMNEVVQQGMEFTNSPVSLEALPPTLAGQNPLFGGQNPSLANDDVVLMMPRNDDGTPRTLADLAREARGMMAMTPEQRAAVSAIKRPLDPAGFMYDISDTAFDDVLLHLQEVPDLVKRLANTPGFSIPINLLARTTKMTPGERSIEVLGWQKRLFEEIEFAKATVAAARFRYLAENPFRFRKIRTKVETAKFVGGMESPGVWKAQKIRPALGANVNHPRFATMNHIVENQSQYLLTDPQKNLIRMLNDTSTNLLRKGQLQGVDVTELAVDYFKRIMLYGPKEAEPGNAIKNLFASEAKRTGPARAISSGKEFTKQRVLKNVEDAGLGYTYESDPFFIAGAGWRSQILAYSNALVRKRLNTILGGMTAAERIKIEGVPFVKTLKVAREDLAATRSVVKADRRAGRYVPANIHEMRQAELEWMEATKELADKKQSLRAPKFGDVVLPNGQQVPTAINNEIQKWIDFPEFLASRDKTLAVINDTFRMMRNIVANLDLAAGFIQGQGLFFADTPKWFTAMFHSVKSIAGEPYAYYGKHWDTMQQGIDVGAIVEPTDFLFTQRGIPSLPTRIPVVGPVMKVANRAFETFIVVAQHEVFLGTLEKTSWKALAKAGVVELTKGADGVFRYKVTRDTAGAELVRQTIKKEQIAMSRASSKFLGTQSYNAIGIPMLQQTVEALSLFAARFFRAIQGIVWQAAFTGGPGGNTAKRLMGRFYAGAVATTIAISMATTGKMPELMDPDRDDWMLNTIGKSRFSTFGPFHGFNKTIARVGKRLGEGDVLGAAKHIKTYMTSKQSIAVRAGWLGAGLVANGHATTWDGDTIDLSDPVSALQGLTGELASPIAPTEIWKGLHDGRPEAIAEIFGLAGKSSPWVQLDILYMVDRELNPEGLPLRTASPSQRQAIDLKYPEIAARVLKSGRGPYGEVSRKWAEIDADFYLVEVDLLRKLGLPSADGESINKTKFRNEMDKEQGIRIALKHLVRQEHDLFPDDQELPEDLNDRALAQYYRLVSESITRPEGLDEKSTFPGHFDGEDFSKGLEVLNQEWTGEQMQYVEDNTSLTIHAPGIQQFYDDKKYLARVYWSRIDDLMDQFKQTEKWERFQRLDKYEQRIMLDKDPYFEEVLEVGHEIRKAMRGGFNVPATDTTSAFIDHDFDPLVEEAMLRWGYIDHPASESLWEEFFKDVEVITP